MKEFHIALIKGDGIGPEVIAEAVKVLQQAGSLYDVSFVFTSYPAGGDGIDQCGQPLPAETIEGCKQADAVLLGAVGGPKWDHLSGSQRPEAAILGLRSQLELFANLRPATLFAPLAHACPLRDSLIAGGFDIMIVRELTGGIYFGEKGRSGVGAEERAYDIMPYSRLEIERIGRVAFETARKRQKKVTSVDKANVLETSRLWRRVMAEIAQEYPDVCYQTMLVDNAAMQLVRDPRQFDVMVMENMFGDILSDEAAMLTGSIGLLASASLGKGSLGLYEPSHGSAPDIAGKDLANPIATILSAAMMCRYSLQLPEVALTMEQAVSQVLAAGHRTADIAAPGETVLGTAAMGDLICKAIKK